MKVWQAAVIAAIVIPGCTAITSVINQPKPELASEFARLVKAIVVTEPSFDTDGDGYASATIERNGELIGIQCPTVGNVYANDCKLDSAKAFGLRR